MFGLLSLVGSLLGGFGFGNSSRESAPQLPPQAMTPPYEAPPMRHSKAKQKGPSRSKGSITRRKNPFRGMTYSEHFGVATHA